MYDIVIYRRKLNKVKVIACLLILVGIISICVHFGMRVTTYAINYQYTETVLAKADMWKQEEDTKQEQVSVETIVTNEPKEHKPVTVEQVGNLFNHTEKVAYLTFDDGPSSVTSGILDVLAQYNVKATFFMLGLRVEQSPETVKRMYQEGHYLANHGYSHQYSSIYSSPQAVMDEYNATEIALQNALQNPNYHSNLFRFPGGSHGGNYHDVKQQAKQLLQDSGVASLDWNALTKDAEGAHTKEAVLQNLWDTVGEKQQVVILMHDTGDKSQTLEALPDVIGYLQWKGYTLKNMYDLIP